MIAAVVSGLRQAAMAISGTLLLLTVLAFGWGVWGRYVLGDPSEVSGEVAVLALIWAVMIAGGLAMRPSEQIGVDFLGSGRGARMVRALGAGAAAAILLAALPVTIDYVAFLWRERTPALRLRLDLVYACFPLFQGAMGLQLLASAARLARAPRRAG